MCVYVCVYVCVCVRVCMRAFVCYVLSLFYSWISEISVEIVWISCLIQAALRREG